MGCTCLFLSGNYDGALALIGDFDEVEEWEKPEEKESVSLSSRTACARAKIFEALENRTQSGFWYLESLRRDLLNYEAFGALKEYHLLNAEQEEELVQQVRGNRDFVRECGISEEDNKRLLWELYESKLEPYKAPLEEGREEDWDLVMGRCEKLYYNCRYGECLEGCRKVLAMEGGRVSSLAPALLPLYLG